jgi:hypothetical protein
MEVKMPLTVSTPRMQIRQLFRKLVGEEWIGPTEVLDDAEVCYASGLITLYEAVEKLAQHHNPQDIPEGKPED